MNPAAPIFATVTRVAGAVLIVGYVSGIVPGAVMSLVGGLALITFGRALMLDRMTTALSGAALAIAAGALGVGALRWGTLSLSELVGAQSVLGPTIIVGPEVSAVSSGVALGAALVAVAAWSIEPPGTDRRSRMWSRVEGILAVLVATVVFAAPGTGGGLSELLSSPLEVAVTVGVVLAGSAVVWFGPALLRSRRLRWAVLGFSGIAVLAAAGIIAGSL